MILLKYFLSLSKYQSCPHLKTVTLSFNSVFDLCEFLRQVNISNAEVHVNVLIGKFPKDIIALAITKFQASILAYGKKVDFLF